MHLLVLTIMENGIFQIAIKFINSHIDNSEILTLLGSLKDGDMSKFSEFKSMVESYIYAKFLANEFIDNFVDFEDLAD